MAVPTLLLTLATLLCASAAPAREVLFASSPSESIDARTSYSSGAGLVSPWSGADPQANAVTAYLSKDPVPWTFPLPTESVESDACQEIDMSTDLIAYINCINGDDATVTKIKMPSEEIDLSTDLADDTFYLHVRAYATDPAHSRKIGTIEVRLEFNHAVCRPCPEAGPCVGLTGEGRVASVTNPSLAPRGDLAGQYINTVSGTFTKWGHVTYESGSVQTFDMGYIKMQAVGPGQCVVKAELSAFFECCGTDGMPAPDGHRYKWPQDEPKIPVAANKLVNCPPGGCLPSAPPTPPTPPPPSPPPPPPPPPMAAPAGSIREVWTYNAATRTYTKNQFKVLGHIDGREILNKSKNCTRKWWPKWKKTKKATCTNKGKTATCMKLKNKCTVPVEDYA